MAHYAKVRDGIVVDLIVAEPEFFDTFVDSSAGTWIQTSYNTKGGIHYQEDGVTPSTDQSKALRKNYAGVGYNYDYANDAFYPPQPFVSWSLNEETFLWEAPTPYPTDGNEYEWNESTQSWDLIEEVV
jgi:hypothetical protein